MLVGLAGVSGTAPAASQPKEIVRLVPVRNIRADRRGKLLVATEGRTAELRVRVTATPRGYEGIANVNVPHGTVVAECIENITCRPYRWNQVQLRISKGKTATFRIRVTFGAEAVGSDHERLEVGLDPDDAPEQNSVDGSVEVRVLRGTARLPNTTGAIVELGILELGDARRGIASRVDPGSLGELYLQSAFYDPDGLYYRFGTSVFGLRIEPSRNLGRFTMTCVELCSNDLDPGLQRTEFDGPFSGVARLRFEPAPEVITGAVRITATHSSTAKPLVGTYTWSRELPATDQTGYLRFTASYLEAQKAYGTNPVPPFNGFPIAAEASVGFGWAGGKQPSPDRPGPARAVARLSKPAGWRIGCCFTVNERTEHIEVESSGAQDNSGSGFVTFVSRVTGDAPGEVFRMEVDGSALAQGGMVLLTRRPGTPG